VDSTRRMIGADSPCGAGRRLRSRARLTRRPRRCASRRDRACQARATSNCGPAGRATACGAGCSGSTELSPSGGRRSRRARPEPRSPRRPVRAGG
jgi:hypothetical protein